MEYIGVQNEITGVSIEFPVTNNSVKLDTIKSIYPSAHGLIYQEEGRNTAVEFDGNRKAFNLPLGWKTKTFRLVQNAEPSSSRTFVYGCDPRCWIFYKQEADHKDIVIVMNRKVAVTFFHRTRQQFVENSTEFEIFPILKTTQPMKVKVAKIVPNLDLVYLEPLNGYFPYLADIGRPKPGMKFTVGGFDNSGSFNKAYSTGQIYTAEDNWRNLNGEKKGPFWIATANTSLGDSGAPCINSDGLLIGMTVQLTNITERFQNIAIGAAVPLVADNLIIGADVMKYSGLELFDITIESKDFILDMSKW